MIDYANIVRLKKLPDSTVNSIANAIGCKWDTVDNILTKCEEVWGSIENVPANLSSAEIRQQIFAPKAVINTDFLQPDPEKILEEQRKYSKTRSELWAEYKKEAKRLGKQAYKLSRFNEIITGYADSKDICFKQKKLPGIEAQVDWVGDKGRIYDNDTGEVIYLHLFVLALPYSGYFFVKAYLDEKMPSWLDGHKSAFEFFGGCPAMMVPDNCKTAVNQGRKWYFDEVVLNPKYARFMEHYNVIVAPARVYHPKDKSVVERSVQVVEKDLIKQVDRLHLTTVDEYNRILRKKLVERLKVPYSKRIGSRTGIFEAEEKKELLPLPMSEYQSFTEREAVVGRDFHIQYQKVHYSVPSDYIRETVVVRDYGAFIRIYDRKYHKLIAEHRKAMQEWAWVTDDAHIPVHYGDHDGYSPEYFISWAQKFGPMTAAWATALLDHYETPVRAFKTLYTALQAAKSYDNDVVEVASSDCLDTRIWTAKQFKILLASYQKDKADSSREPEFDTDDFYVAH